ncbi:MAG: potassium/proton antiporter [Rhizobiales bacterium]|nr:potassium/proton antiporter [Hyphomicrobiales bacterium]
MLDSMYLAILIGAGLVMVAVFTTWIAFRFGAPLLLIFLAVGLFAGEDGLGLEFDNSGVAYFLGSVALSVILFDSGFGTKLAAFRLAALPAMALATFGVVITAGLVAVAAWLIFGFPWLQASLLGAIVSSTDAAAVFFLLRVGGIHLRDRVRSVLEVESGCNDPMAIFLTLALLELITVEALDSSVGLAFAWAFIREIGLGFVLGLVGGLGIVRLVNRLDLESGLYPVVVLAASLALFGIAGTLHCSGFLAVYVAGLYAGNRKLREALSLKRFQDGMTWLAQIGMFVVFGLFATPSEFPQIALQGLAVALFLIFVARPAAIWLSLWPFRFQREETAFVAWVGLRGAVSLLLALLPLIADLPRGQDIFNATFIVVLASLLVQGWTIKPMARRLGLIIPPTIGPVEKVELELPGTASHELVVYHVVADCPVVRGERIPRFARPSLVVRNGQSMRPQFAGRIEAGDFVYLFAAPRNIRLLDRLFASPAHLEDDDKDFFGEFHIDTSQPLGQLGQAYGVEPPGDPATAIGVFMLERLAGHAEIGDRVAVSFLELIVRDTDESGAVTAAGLALEPEPTLGPSGWPVVRGVVDLAAILRSRLAALRRSRR